MSKVVSHAREASCAHFDCCAVLGFPLPFFSLLIIVPDLAEIHLLVQLLPLYTLFVDPPVVEAVVGRASSLLRPLRLPLCSSPRAHHQAELSWEDSVLITSGRLTQINPSSSQFELTSAGQEFVAKFWHIFKCVAEVCETS